MRGLKSKSLAAAFLIVALLALFSARLENWEFATQDWRFRLRGERPPSPAIVLVALDERAWLQEGAWPWPLEKIARLVDALSAAGARVIALDSESLILLTQPSSAPLADLAALEQSLARSGRVLLPAVLLPADRSAPLPHEAHAWARFAAGQGRLPGVPPAERRLVAPAESLLRHAAGLGLLNVFPETDRVLRRMPLVLPQGDSLYPSLAAEIARLYWDQPPGGEGFSVSDGHVNLGGERLPCDAAGEFTVNYAGGYQTYPQISAADVLGGEGAGSAPFRDRIVIVGHTSGPQASTFPTPTSPRLPAPEIQANAAASLLHGAALHPLASWLGWALALVGSLGLALCLQRRSTGFSLLFALVVLGSYFVFSLILFRYHLVLPTALPLLAMGLTGAVVVILQAEAAELDRAHAESHYAGRLHSLTSVGELLARGWDREQLLQDILRWVQRELQVEAVSLLLLEERQRRLRFEASLGGAADQIMDFSLELGEGIAGAVALSGEPAIVNDARQDPRQSREMAEAVNFPAQSILCVPMTHRGRVVGVLEALNRRSGSPFTSADADLLTVIAQQAAMFLDNARLYAELQSRVDFANRELREANQQLAGEKARIETLLREMASGVLATDEAERILLLNAAAEDMLGLRQERVLGESVFAVLRDERLTAMFAAPLSLSGGRLIEELELPPDSGRVFQAYLTTFELEGEAIGKILLLSDITDLVELDRMKTDLISFVSHELKNPLSAMLGFVRLLRGAPQAGAEPVSTYTQYLERQALRMEQLVRGYLNIVRLEAGHSLEVEWEEIRDLEELVEGLIAAELGSQSDREIRLEVPEDLPPFWADRDKLEHILVNLLSNAIKYTPEGTPITVRAEGEGEWCRLAVADEGPGLPPAAREHLFEKFRRGRGPGAERVPGTGLGLYLCKHLVEAHGGRIWVESAPGEGATFCFILPLCPPPEEA